MAFNLFGGLMPKEESFTKLFCEQVDHAVRACSAIRQVMNAEQDAEQIFRTIRTIEEEADAVAKKIFVAANRTFNAPIDREDILELTHELDDIVDLVEDTAKVVQRYGIREFSEEMRSMAEAAVSSAELLGRAIPLLDSITKDYRTILSVCESIGGIEGQADELFDTGLTKLRVRLTEGAIATIAYLDQKEIYELLEDVADKCDDVANTLESITAKHV